MYLRSLQRFRFSIYSNQHQQAREIINNREIVYDTCVYKYEPTIQAYLQKRWTKKQEIPAKIYVIDQLQSIRDSLNQQNLYPLKILLDQSRLEKMYLGDEITPSYIISTFCEEYFKPMMDEYVKKILLNGRVVPLKHITEYEQIQTQVLKYYRAFFYGDELSDLEKEIEYRYLQQKQQKFYRYQAHQRAGDKCIWTYSQQRCLERILNWQSKSIDAYDYQRPIYEPLHLEKRFPLVKQILQIDGFSKWQLWIFELLQKRNYTKSRTSTDWVVSTVFTRILLHTNSNQFIKSLNVPPDFHIEHSIVNMHVWLLIDRLKKIGTGEAKYAYRILDQVFQKYTQGQISKIHLRKKNDFIKDVDSYMRASRAHLDYHFNKNTKTLKNHYVKLDALVWSLIFFEKVPRYSNAVYVMAEYLKANYDYIQTMTMQDFFDADIQFDVFKCSLDFKDKLLSINPPLDEDEFYEEFTSDKSRKKYYYSYDEGETFKMPTEVSDVFERSDKERRLDNLTRTIGYNYKKFSNLKNFDHFSNLEEQRKEKNKSQKYFWEKNEKQFEDLDEIKKAYMQRNQRLN